MTRHVKELQTFLAWRSLETEIGVKTHRDAPRSRATAYRRSRHWSVLKHDRHHDPCPRRVGHEATVARWAKQAGDAVKRDELLVELETDKVSLEVVAPEDGVLSDIDAEEGATVVPGQRLGRVGAGVGAPSIARTAIATASKAAAPAPHPPQQQAAALSPSVLRIVTENNLDPAAISGGGKDGRITKGDALAAVEARTAEPISAAAPPAPAPITPLPPP